MAAPSIRPIRNCLYGRHIGSTRRHGYHHVSRAFFGAPASARVQAAGRAARAHIVERTSGRQFLLHLLHLRQCHMQKLELVISSPPMLTLPSWSSNASHMILFRKLLKGVGERGDTIVRDCSSEPVSCAGIEHDCTLVLSYRFSMTRMMLGNGMYVAFPHSAHKASCHTLSKAFLKSMKTW